MPTFDSHHLLNSSVTRLTGEEIDFFIHYWGTTVTKFEHPVHKHSFYEVCYVMQGEGVYREEEQLFPLRPGTVFLSRPGQFHQIQYGSDMVMLFVGFEAELNPNLSKLPALMQYQLLRETKQFVVQDEEAAVTIHTWQALWAQAANPSPSFGSVLRQLSYALLCSFHQLFVNRDPVSSIVPDTRQHSRSLIYQAQLFIQDNLAAGINAQDVANYLYISRRHLARLFANEEGSFTGYLRKKQIERAVLLLMDKQLPIKDIAELSGFHSLHYFTKIFSQVMGMPPGRFRTVNT